ncbi:PREDICTED: F-box protein SKIP16 [Tarenaya hassleriana]|uniref:F-box protein SKIP16 n=1 Tax=Tarenaya hassleriana TaxID=28532 RepID=UPI00053C92FD|nr:PREDICTED: F-box protein SKIP16 [Tarenaya hassleriana]
MGLEEAGDLVLHIILSELGPEGSARVSCVSKRLRVFASEDSLWSLFCFRDLNLSTPLDPHGNLSPSFKAAYLSWREAFGMYPWTLVKRVNRCWGNLKSWLSINFPEAEATLKKGATEADIHELESALKVKLPLPTRVLYRFFNGQEFSCQSLGLIGGYSLYSHVVNVSLLPLGGVIKETKEIIRQLGFSRRSKYIVVAVSSTFNFKVFFLNCANGQLYVGTRNLVTEGEMLPCVPDSLIRSVHDVSGEQQQDGMLLWLEEHVRRLQNGTIKIREQENTKTISLFPEIPPLCSVAATNGVQVRASSVFIPEVADLQSETQKYWYAYTIRMSLLPEGCILNGIHHSSCQLHMRHWLIRANNAIIDDVNGEAVIGMYPFLRAGSEEFVYESCSSLPAASGSIEGSFTFVPGSLTDPKGGPFEAKVAEFPLQLPDYIF